MSATEKFNTYNKLRNLGRKTAILNMVVRKVPGKGRKASGQGWGSPALSLRGRLSGGGESGHCQKD